MSVARESAKPAGFVTSQSFLLGGTSRPVNLNLQIFLDGFGFEVSEDKLNSSTSVASEWLEKLYKQLVMSEQPAGKGKAGMTLTPRYRLFGTGRNERKYLWNLQVLFS